MRNENWSLGWEKETIADFSGSSFQGLLGPDCSNMKSEWWVKNCKEQGILFLSDSFFFFWKEAGNSLRETSVKESDLFFLQDGIKTVCRRESIKRKMKKLERINT